MQLPGRTPPNPICSTGDESIWFDAIQESGVTLRSEVVKPDEVQHSPRIIESEEQPEERKDRWETSQVRVGHVARGDGCTRRGRAIAVVRIGSRPGCGSVILAARRSARQKPPIAIFAGHSTTSGSMVAAPHAVRSLQPHHLRYRVYQRSHTQTGIHKLAYTNWISKKRINNHLRRSSQPLSTRASYRRQTRGERTLHRAMGIT